MPYPGIKPGSKAEAKLERCVKDLMTDPDFKPRKGKSKKSSAIAVCRASIMGTKKVTVDTSKPLEEIIEQVIKAKADIEKVQEIDGKRGGDKTMKKKKIKKQDETPIKKEKTPVKEETPVKKEEAPVKEEKASKLEKTVAKLNEVLEKLEKSTEKKKVIKKKSNKLQKVNDSIQKMADELEDYKKKYKKLAKRVKAIEKQPAPSDVESTKVAEKAEEKSDPELEKIEKRLGELDEIKDNDLDRFQKGRMWEEAIQLVEKKNRLLEA